MPFKILQNILNITIIIATVLNTSCSILQKNISKNYNIKQGNHLKAHDIQKIHIGMTKPEISHAIGLPTLQDLFETNIWYYIYYNHHHHAIKELQTITLIFDKNNILIDFKK